MRDKVTLSEKCIELAKRVGDDKDEPPPPLGDGGFDEAIKIASNMPQVGSEATYRSLHTIFGSIFDKISDAHPDEPSPGTTEREYVAQ